MCEQTKNPESFYSYIGNFFEDRDELVREYAFDNKNVAEARMLKSWDWKPKRYSDIHPFVKNLCEIKSDLKTLAHDVSAIKEDVQDIKHVINKI